MMNINFTENSQMSNAKIKTEAKIKVMEVITKALIEAFGEENCAYVRTGATKNKTKEFAVKIGTVEKDGETYDLCAVVNSSIKDYRERTSERGKVYPAFDFDEMVAEYKNYEELKEKAVVTKKEKVQKAKAKREAAEKVKSEEVIDNKEIISIDDEELDSF